MVLLQLLDQTMKLSLLLSSHDEFDDVRVETSGPSSSSSLDVNVIFFTSLFFQANFLQTAMLSVCICVTPQVWIQKISFFQRAQGIKALRCLKSPLMPTHKWVLLD